MPGLPELLREGQRQLTICNACRYCEGYCAVFPATERRVGIGLGDLIHLANLCHDCRACYQACMYAPPHEFAVDLPALFSAARRWGYQRYARPRFLGGAFRRPVLAATLASAVGGALALATALGRAGIVGLTHAQEGVGAFYRVIAYPVMLAGFLVLTALVLGALVVGCRRLWRDTGGGHAIRSPRAWVAALGDALSLRLLSGGGAGCYRPHPQRPSPALRRLHQLLVGGFFLTFAATVAAAVEQDLMGRLPPYPPLSPPVALGTVGGIAIVAAAGVLLRMNAGAHEPLGTVLLALSEAVAVSGLLLLVLRTTVLMGPLLVLHLGAVVGLFVALPYGKLVHAAHRVLALVREQAETLAERG